MIKRWDDMGYEQKRPDTITVTLLKDGTVYDTRTISRTDSWQYTWSGIPRYSPDGTEIVWTIQENAVPGYISSIRETGDTFILTNTPEHPKEKEKAEAFQRRNKQYRKCSRRFRNFFAGHPYTGNCS